ncbi:hypothetical protein C2W64_00024 [Brevibacillus laterosporus]|nr:hypothetical protein C2W64_00024 [Brevibacillus laterosporus]
MNMQDHDLFPSSQYSNWKVDSSQEQHLYWYKAPLISLSVLFLG